MTTSCCPAYVEMVKKFIPDFIKQSPPNSEKTFDGAEFDVGDVKLRFFESGHTRGSSAVREYGFCIEYREESYIFPTDVRDYGFAFPKFKNPRALFAHLWLGKGCALVLEDNEYVDDFCRFVESFGAKENYVAHLYDIHRTIDEMWSEVNFEMVKSRIDNLKMFKVGDIINF